LYFFAPCYWRKTLTGPTAEINLYWSGGKWNLEVDTIISGLVKWEGGTDPCDPTSGWGSHTSCTGSDCGILGLTTSDVATPPGF